MNTQVVWDILWNSLTGGNYDVEALRARARDDSDFVADMGIDSLDLVEFFLRLEEQTSVKLDADEYQNLTSVAAIAKRF
jgi:acyl carrier protein